MVPVVSAAEAFPKSDLTKMISDFEVDLKSKKVLGLKDLAIRKVSASSGATLADRSRLEMLVTEKIIEIARTRVIHCVACNALSEDPSAKKKNAAELARIIKLTGIRSFMAIHYSEQKNDSSLSFAISNASDGKQLWSKTYHSRVKAVP